MIQQALMLAFKAHEGQKDRSGNPFIFHPIAVALNCFFHTDKVVAILHDVVEDTHITLPDLQALFPAVVCEAVDHISQRKHLGETYKDFIKRCCLNATARRVKKADLHHNSGRLNELPEVEAESLGERYRWALNYITQYENDLEIKRLIKK